MTEQQLHVFTNHETTLSGADMTKERPEANEFQSYREYLAFLSARNPIFSWLSAWFEYRSEEQSCSATMIDVVDGHLKTHDKVDLSGLRSRPDTVQTRLILFSYEEVTNIDYANLDDICFAFQLDPYCIWRILEDDYAYLDSPIDVRDATKRPDGLVQENSLNKFVFEMSYEQYQVDKCSTMLIDALGSGIPDTILLFCKEARTLQRRPTCPNVGYASIRHGRHAQPAVKSQMLSGLFLEELRRWPRERLLAVKESPFELALPYYKLLLNQAMEAYEGCRYKTMSIMDPNFSEFWPQHLEDEEEQHFEAWILAERLTTSVDSFHEFASWHGITSSASVQHMNHAMRMLIVKSTRLKDTLKDRLSRRASLMSLEESRKSIELTDSVRTLTQLAFVFVPLTFGTSIFGANLQEFGSGIVPVWKFVVALVGVVLCTALISWIWSIGRDGIVRVSRNVSRNMHAILLFGLRSPGLAVLLSLHVLFHLHDEPLRPVKELGILQLSYPASGNFVYISPVKFPPAPESMSWYKGFWVDCLFRIGQYTSQNWWFVDRFYKPSIRARRLEKLKADNVQAANRV